MQSEALKLRITRHAYRQYRRRVAKDGLKFLYQEISDALECRDYYQKREWLQVDGIWWIHSTAAGQITLVTCYGRHDLDLPSALKWARHNKDRISLKYSL